MIFVLGFVIGLVIGIILGIVLASAAMAAGQTEWRRVTDHDDIDAAQRALPDDVR